MGSIRGNEWIILVLAGLVLFGGKKLPDFARGLGRSIRIFKSEMNVKDDQQHTDDEK